MKLVKCLRPNFQQQKMVKEYLENAPKTQTVKNPTANFEDKTLALPSLSPEVLRDFQSDIASPGTAGAS